MRDRGGAWRVLGSRKSSFRREVCCNEDPTVVLTEVQCICKELESLRSGNIGIKAPINVSLLKGKIEMKTGNYIRYFKSFFLKEYLKNISSMIPLSCRTGAYSALARVVTDSWVTTHCRTNNCREKSSRSWAAPLHRWLAEGEVIGSN